jgi:hypothetical protein
LADEPLAIPPKIAVVYVRFFHAQWAAPLQYLGSFNVKIPATFGDIFELVNLTLGLDIAMPLTCFEETRSKTIRQLATDAERSTQFVNLTHGASLVFQLAGEAEIPFQPAPAIPKPAVSGPVASTLRLADHAQFGGPAPTTLSGYYARTISPVVLVTLFAWGESEPVCLLRFPICLTYNEFQAFVAWAAEIPVDFQNDTLLLYKRDPYHDRPQAISMAPSTQPTMTYAFQSADGGWGLYYRFVPGITTEDWKKSDAYRVSFSEDAKAIAKRSDLVVPKRSGFDDIVEQLIGIGFLTAFDPARMRAMAMKDGRFMRAVSLTDPLIPPLIDEIRIENIPEDQLELAADEGLVQVVTATVSTSEYLQPIGTAFLFKLKKQASLSDVKEAILGNLGVEGDAKSQVRFFVGGDYVRFSRQGQLPDTDVFSKDDLKRTLYAVLDSKKAPSSLRRPRQEALQIYN